jgi:hypothetical protein
MDGRDLTFDGIGQCAGSTWADGGGRQALADSKVALDLQSVGAGKHHRIFESGH